MKKESVYRLDELSTIITGETPPKNQPDSWGSTVDFLTPSDQTAGVRRANPERRLSQLGAARHAKRIVPAGSTNLTCIGATIGKVTQTSQPCLTNQQINSLIPRLEVCDPDYLYYRISDWSGQLAKDAVGSATPLINKSTLASYKLTVPPLATQTAIGEVLGALDDKIAANTRITDTGVALVDALYAGTPKNRGEATFADLAVLGGGGTPSTKVDALWGDDHRWATPSDVTALSGPWIFETGRRISEAGLQRISSKLHPPGTILMTSRASIGHCALTFHPIAVNQGFVTLAPHQENYRAWLFAQLRARTREFEAWANGATFLELPKGIFRTLPVDLPTVEDLGRFAAKVEPVLARVAAAQQESQTLASVRDELLPQLMSGRITVRDAEKTVEEVV